MLVSTDDDDDDDKIVGAQGGLGKRARARAPWNDVRAAKPRATWAAPSLFFGSFVHLSYEEFNEAMEGLLNDPGRGSDAMVKEIYTLGQFLAQKKYRYLRWAYLLFLSGLFGAGVVQATVVALQHMGYTIWVLHFTPPGA